jgi:hypothetical protein
VEWCQRKTGKALAPSQRKALEQALASRALVITGGAVRPLRRYRCAIPKAGT